MKWISCKREFRVSLGGITLLVDRKIPAVLAIGLYCRNCTLTMCIIEGSESFVISRVIRHELKVHVIGSWSDILWKSLAAQWTILPVFARWHLHVIVGACHIGMVLYIKLDEQRRSPSTPNANKLSTSLVAKHFATVYVHVWFLVVFFFLSPFKVAP